MKRKECIDAQLLASLALLLIYTACSGGRLYSIDGFLVFRQAVSLAFDHNVHFPRFAWGGTEFTTSFYSIGPSLIQVPTLLALWMFHTPRDYDPNLYVQPLFTIGVAPLFIIITACSALLVGRILEHLGFSSRISLLGLLLYGIASPAVVYARGDFAQPLEGLCWLLALYATFIFFSKPDPVQLITASAATFYAAITRPMEGTFLAAAVIAYAAARVRENGRPNRESVYFLFSVSQAFALAFLLTLVWDAARYGSLFDVGVRATWTTPLATGLAGSLFSPGRGLLWSFPVAVLAPIGVWNIWIKGMRGTAAVLAGLVVIQLVSVAKWSVWFGGVNWGLRIFFTALPVLAVLAAAGLSALTGFYRRAAAVVSFLGGMAWAVPCIVTDLFGGGPEATSAAAFHWRSYPLVGAVRTVKHVFAQQPGDVHAVDILWFRMANATHYFSLLIPIVLIPIAAILIRYAFRRLDTPEFRGVPRGTS